MACVTCGPSFSQNLYNPFKEAGHWVDGPKVMLNNLVPHIKPHLLDVDSAYFAGGEPLITEQILEILQYWIDNNHTPSITVCSNLTVDLSNKNSPIHLLKKFEHVHFLVSVDGTEEVIKNIRLGVNFNNICNNIKILKDLNFDIQISPTVSILNIHNIPELYNYMSDKFNLKEKNWLINLLQAPQGFSITNLSNKKKKKAEQLMTDLPKSIKDKILNYMYSEEPNQEWYDMAISFQKTLQDIWNR